MLIAGWSYAYYSFSIGERSLQSPFGPIIWPLKTVIPVSAFLLLLQVSHKSSSVSVVSSAGVGNEF
jgi:TRAP-type mannitol/chloroaromatic compound transport system permease small subunit